MSQIKNIDIHTNSCYVYFEVEKYDNNLANKEVRTSGDNFKEIALGIQYPACYTLCVLYCTAQQTPQAHLTPRRFHNSYISIR